MDPRILSFVHLASVMLLFTSFGAVILGAAPRHQKAASILHGISLLLLFISGFGLLGVLKLMSMKFWIAKIIILLLFGGALTLAKRKILHPPVSLSIVLGLGFAAAYLGIYKPF